MSPKPQPEIRQEVRAFLEQYVDCAEADDDVDLFAAGYINSLFAMQLVLFVEGEYGVSLEPRDLTRANFGSIAGIARLVESKSK